MKEIEGEEELDDILKADARPVVLLAGFTWCRPCKVSRGHLAMQFNELLEVW